MFPLVKKIIDGIPLVLIMIDCAAHGTHQNMGSTEFTTLSYNIMRSAELKVDSTELVRSPTGVDIAINACNTQNKFEYESENLDLTSRDRTDKGIKAERGVNVVDSSNYTSDFPI